MLLVGGLGVEGADLASSSAAASSGDLGAHGRGGALEASALEDDSARDAAERAAEALPPEASVEQAVAAAEVDSAGYITVPVGPWSALPVLGRLTSWPEEKPVELRSVSCRCRMHPRCSVTKARRRITDAQLVAWLVSASPLPLDTQPAARKLAADEHKAAFKRMLDA